MKKILILGGTKYAGKAFIEELRLNENYDFTVLSRQKVKSINYVEGDRKNEELLTSLLKVKYDIIIDFICHCLPDAEKLISAISSNNSNPRIIFISTTYVYDQDANKSFYEESDFDALEYQANHAEREKISYQEGKRSAEAFFVQNYGSNNLSILRFPIILGKNDYTLRSSFFIKYFENGGSFDQISFSGKSNFIFVSDVVNVLKKQVEDFRPGTFNIVRPEFLCQRGLALMYSKAIKYSTQFNRPDNLEKTPFFYRSDFKINGSKYHRLNSFEGPFLSQLKLILT